MSIRKRIKRYTVGQVNSVKNWTGALVGIPCFIIGNGPSLNRQNLALVDNRFFSIGINRAFYKIDPTILLFQDLQLWHTDKHRILKSNAIKYCRDRADIQGRFYHFKLATGDYCIPKNALMLHGRGSSGPLAFQLAHILGCDPVVLVAMDCRYEDDMTDFYGVNPMHKPHTLRNCTKGLKWIRDVKGEKNIFNCSDNKVFEKKFTLEETVKRLENISPMNRETLSKKILYHNR